MYKALFTDLDGTLFDDEKNISKENLKAIENIKSQGKIVTLCSGRQIDFVRRQNEKIGNSDYIIASNGAVIYDCKNNELVRTSAISREQAKYLIEYGNSHGFLVRIDTDHIRYLNDMEKSVNTELELGDDIDKFLDQNVVVHITLCAEKKEDLAEIKKYVEDAFELEIANDFISKFKGYRFAAINIGNRGVSKGNAIIGLCKYLKIDLTDVVAMGDDLNDISMMTFGGTGVAMENAMPEVKEKAKYITASNNENGVAKAINKFF